jgi:hypothetical protein
MAQLDTHKGANENIYNGFRKGQEDMRWGY